jgi:predicted PurR-regulated permease PerM
LPVSPSPCFRSSISSTTAAASSASAQLRSAGFAGPRGSSGDARLALAGVVRAGNILVALTDSIGVLIVALILGVPVAPALAALVFLGAFVPIVGALVSGSVAVLVALVALGWPQALIMLGGVILVMQIEGHIAADRSCWDGR